MKTTIVILTSFLVFVYTSIQAMPNTLDDAEAEIERLNSRLNTYQVELEKLNQNYKTLRDSLSEFSNRKGVTYGDYIALSEKIDNETNNMFFKIMAVLGFVVAAGGWGFKLWSDNITKRIKKKGGKSRQSLVALSKELEVTLIKVIEDGKEDINMIFEDKVKEVVGAHKGESMRLIDDKINRLEQELRKDILEFSKKMVYKITSNK